MAQAEDGVLSSAQASKLARDLSNEPAKVHAIAKIARARDSEILGFVERLLAVAEGKTVRPHALVAGLNEAMKVLTRAAGADPLSAVDDPLPLTEASGAVALAEAQAAETRRVILRECVSAEAAEQLTRRSRQSLERLRRAGRVLALREGNQWRYPRWQFDPDARGGIVPGIGDVLQRLRLSPAGTAHWLTRRHERLKAAPIQLLRAGRVEPVVQAAREHGERP
jgi:hypothetical protein